MRVSSCKLKCSRLNERVHFVDGGPNFQQLVHVGIDVVISRVLAKQVHELVALEFGRVDDRCAEDVWTMEGRSDRVDLYS